jgi:hypothetical protein
VNTGFVQSDIATLSKALGFAPNRSKPYGWDWYVNDCHCTITLSPDGLHPYTGHRWIITSLLEDNPKITLRHG